MPRGQEGADALPDDDFLDDEPAERGAPDGSAIHVALTARDAGERLDKALARHLSQYSRSRLQQWIEDGSVTVDGKPARPKSAVYGDETIVVVPRALPEEQAFAAEPVPLEVVHDDDAIAILDKPAGLVVHPAAGNWSGTLMNGLLHRWPALAGVPRAGIVHRLDKDTSGLMAVAKTLEAHADLVRQLQARTVRRRYLALAWGNAPASGTVDAAMARHPRDRIKMAVSESPFAKHAVTHYERLAQGALDGRPVSLLLCRLETGRTHQIRVHMQSIGLPLVGDPLYSRTHLAAVFPRQALHAWQLGLVHPATGELREWRADPPVDLRALIARAGIDEPAEEA